MRNNYLKKYLLLFALVFLSVQLFAQTRSVTGKIVDENNQSLPGATVAISGTTIAASTDINGVFRINALKAGTYTLTASFIGYTSQPKTITVSTDNLTVNFNLQPTSKSLNEVVVIGYGTVQKKDLTGAVTNVTSKDFNQGAITTPEQLIQGKVAGVSISTNGGAPGAGSTIRIRGGASISGDSSPLIVIDGVPLSSDGIAGAGNPLDLINPNDIESFSILKDASAAAIYGNRGSNGVIIITTKKGQSGKPQINFNTQFSLSKLTKEAPILSADQFRAYIAANDTTTAKKYVSLLGKANTDWQKQIYQTAYNTDNNLSISGSAVKGKLPYRVSVGYNNQDGILKTSSLERYSSNVNLSPSLFTDHLKINFNFIGTEVKQRFANEGAIGSANSFDPTQPVYSGNGNYGGFYEVLDPTATTGLKSLAPLNPLGLLMQNTNRSNVYRAITSLALDYKFHFFPDLHAIVNVSYDGSNGQGNDYVPDYAASTYPGTLVGGVLQRGNRSNYKSVVSNKTLEGDLNYSHEFKSIKSKVTALIGYSEQDFKTTATNYSSYFASGVLNPNSVPNYPIGVNAYDLSSIYGRVTYAYDDKYLLSGSLRSDVSTRFAPGIRTGNFPAVSAAWVISQESFLKDNNVLSNLKLRAGYGVTGNQGGIGDYEYLSNYSVATVTAQYQLGNTFYQGYRPGAFYFGRTWEQSATTNIALDYGFLNERINGSIDFYRQKTSKLLAPIPQPALTNFSNQAVGNVGDMEQRGIEFSVNAKIIAKKDMAWSVGFNLTINRNKITNLSLIPNPNFPGLGTLGISGIGHTIAINQIGLPQNSFYTLTQVYGSNGKPLSSVFVDKNGDGIINDSDLSINHSPAPLQLFGFNSDYNYKKWNIGFSARASLGNYLYNNLAASTGIQRNFINPLGIVYNGSSNVLASGLTGNGGSDVLSDYYIQNASFLRMDNAHIGYSFGKILRTNSVLRISGNVSNVFIITNYTGVDPEQFGGVDNNQYPRPRTYTLGLNLSF